MRNSGYALFLGLTLMVIGVPTCVGYCLVLTDGTIEDYGNAGGTLPGAILFRIGVVTAAIGAIVLGRSSYY